MVLGLVLTSLITIAVSEGMAASTAQRSYTNAVRFKTIFSQRSWLDPILTLYKLPVKDCVYECQIRSECQAVNYWRLRQQCALLPMDTADLDRAEAGNPCVYIRKTDVVESSEYTLTSFCPDAPCGMSQICDADIGQCKINECRQHYQLNATVTGNVLLIGSRIRVQCQQWYVPFSYFSSCLPEGNWSDIAQCEYQFDCNLPPNFPNAKPWGLTYEYKTPILENLAVRYVCDSGYKAPNNFSDMTIQCNSMIDPTLDVTWEEPQFQCLRNCWKPPIIGNATVSPGENLENMTKVYSCLPGYELNNDSSWLNENETIVLNTTCQPNGKWTKVNFECIPVCGTPHEIFHGSATEVTHDGGSIFLNYKCNRTINVWYAMAFPYTDIDTKVECLKGMWDEPHFHCVADCLEPPAGPNVTTNATLVTGNSTLEGAVRSYTCDPGLEPDGIVTTICQATGSWSDVNFVCVPVCQVWPTVPNALVWYLNVNGSMTVAGYICNSGYALATSGTIELTCAHPGGPWDEPGDICLIDCYQPPDIENAMVSDGPTVVGSIRTYMCNTGFRTNDTLSSFTTCQSDGIWTPLMFQCDPDCGQPPNVQNAIVYDGTTVKGSIRIYTCNTGFRSNGTSPNFITCLADGNWTSPMLQCVTCPDGWTLFADYCFFYGYSRLPVYDILTFCDNIHPGSYMVELEDATKEDIVIAFLESQNVDTDVCIGLYDTIGDRIGWTWHGTHTPMTYHNFIPGQPEVDEIFAELRIRTGVWEWHGAWNDCNPVCEL